MIKRNRMIKNLIQKNNNNKKLLKKKRLNKFRKKNDIYHHNKIKSSINTKIKFLIHDVKAFLFNLVIKFFILNYHIEF